MLPEIFLRRAYELELSPEQFDKELETFKSQIRSITFEDSDKFDSPHTEGVCSFENKAIMINRDYYSNSLYDGASIEEIAQEIFGTLAHEVHHASVDDLQHYRAETDGYGDITFSANIYAATFGMTEKQFLEEANKGRNNLMQVIESRATNLNRVVAIERNLDCLYNLNYEAESFDYVQAMDIRRQALTGIYAYSIAELTSRFEQEPVNQRKR